MITWVTVWILTVNYIDDGDKESGATSYQLQYATQAICEKQRSKHSGFEISTRCDFQQIPMVKK